MNKMADEELYTKIGTPGTDIERVRMRGKDALNDVIGKMSFSGAFYFIATGREIEPTHLRVFDACLILLMDHGLTPSALIARLMHDANPGEIQVALAAGMMTVGPKYAGTIAGAGALFNQGIAYDGDRDEWAEGVAADAKAREIILPGYGHRYYHDADLRSVRLVGIARDAGVKGDYIDIAYTLETAIEKSRGKRLVLNATGALGAVLSEIRFPVPLMRSVSAVARVAGLVGHVAEESESPLTPALFEFGSNIEYRD